MQDSPQRLQSAINEWKTILDSSPDPRDAALCARFTRDTTGDMAAVWAVLQPTRRSQVGDLLSIAARHNLTLYPISTGRNWGYGPVIPPGPGGVILDLSQLRAIVDFDETLGLVTIEPGVTQKDLYHFLEQRGGAYLVPVTGAGPQCSLIGNVMERGYGITPTTDHFLSAVSLEAVLPDGSLYRSPMESILAGGGHRSVYKWGVGPYLDGLFAQGNFGVVTRMTLALTRRPPVVSAFYFWVKTDEHLEDAVDAIRHILSHHGSGVGGINLINNLRFLSMITPNPRPGERQKPEPLSLEEIRAQSKKRDVPPWLGFGAIYGTPASVRVTQKLIHKTVSPFSRRVLFIDRKRMHLFNMLSRLVPQPWKSQIDLTLSKVELGLRMMEGHPNEVALPLSYWKARRETPQSEFDPARDGCGLLWYSPIIPMKGAQVRRYVELLQSVARDHQMDAPITLTSVSPYAFDSTVPILFSIDDTDQTARAQACYRKLFNEGVAAGFMPYRLGPAFMSCLTGQSHEFLKLNAMIKKAIDPHGLLSPGRYCPEPTSIGQ